MDNSEALLQGKSKDTSNDYHKLSGLLNYEIKENEIRLNFEYAALAIKFLTADIFRVIMSHSNQDINYKSTEAVTQHGLSYQNFILNEKDTELIIKTDKLVLKISKEKFMLKVFNKNGKLIHQDYNKYALGWKKQKVRAWKSFKKNERFYGLGEKTGWLDKKQFVESKCKEYNTAFLYAPNFSLGVNILFEMNKKLAEIMNKFNNYKPEIEETHHIHKKDAPSGTAVSIAEQIYSKLEKFDGWDFHDKPQENKVPVKSIREGEVFGEHKISYNSNEDKIELSHKAKNRNGFALGAVLAAEFIENKNGIYTMSDMLSL